jgi:UPF0716 protein FxsA
VLLTLFVLFILVPTIEISLFIEVGDYIGVWPTIGLTFLTAALGAFLVRSQGLQTLLTAQERMQQGEMPTQQFVEGILLVLSGVLLFTPGFMTDTFGIILLIPFSRHLIAKHILKRMAVVASQRGGASGFTPFNQGASPFAQNDDSKDQQGKVFEGEFERKNDDNNRLN